MSDFFSDLVQQLRTKHLWPVALGLLVSLIAVPLLLAKPAKKASAPSPAATATPAVAGPGGSTSLAALQPVVTDTKPFAEQTGQTKKVRKFARKNPFATPAGESAAATTDAGTAQTPTSSSGTSTTGTTDTGAGSIPTTPTSTDTTTPNYYRHVVTVKFGKADGKKKTSKLTTLKALPDSTTSVVVFLGVQSDGKTAVFLMSSSATSAGDGKCVPSDDECTFIHMKKGDAQTIESVSSDGNVTTYELEVEKIRLDAVSTPTGTTSKSSRKNANSSGKAVTVKRVVKVYKAPNPRKLSPAQKAAQRRKLKRQQHRLELRNARVIHNLGF